MVVVVMVGVKEQPPPSVPGPDLVPPGQGAHWGGGSGSQVHGPAAPRLAPPPSADQSRKFS